MGSEPREVQSPQLARLVSLIAARRVKAGFSQREFSRRLGLNPTTFWHLEGGRRGLQVTELVKAAALLGEDPAELLRQSLSADGLEGSGREAPESEGAGTP